MAKKHKRCTNAKKIQKDIRELKNAPICVELKEYDGGYGGDEERRGHQYYHVSINESGEHDMTFDVQTGEFEGILWWKHWVDYTGSSIRTSLKLAKETLESRRKSKLNELDAHLHLMA